MDAMDEELARVRTARSQSGQAPGHSPTSNNAGSASGGSKRRADEMDEMDAELHASLHAGASDSDSDGEALEPGDYGMIKNFLESFKAQGGLAGPVGSLAGRLEPGWRLPRDS